MTQKEINNGTVTFNNGVTKTLTEYLKDVSNYLIDKLELYRISLNVKIYPKRKKVSLFMYLNY